MKKRAMLFALVFSILIMGFVLGDLGPKPTVSIDVKYNSESISGEFNAVMLDCVKIDKWDDGRKYYRENLISQLNISEYDSSKGCYWEPAYLAWGGDCKYSKCNFGYFPPEDFKLGVYIPSLDKVFISNEILRKNFNSKYNIELNPNGSAYIYDTTPLLQKEEFINIRNFIRALVITLILEILTAYIFFNRKKEIRKRILLSVLIVNLITLPIVWFIFPAIGNTLLVIVFAEIFAFIFEACLIFLMNKKNIAPGKAFILSLIMNLVSLILGGIIYLMIERVRG